MPQVKHLVTATCHEGAEAIKAARRIAERAGVVAEELASKADALSLAIGSIHASLIVGCAYLFLALVTALVVQARRR